MSDMSCSYGNINKNVNTRLFTRKSPLSILKAAISMMAKPGCITAWVRPLRCFLFLVTNFIHVYSIIMPVSSKILILQQVIQIVTKLSLQWPSMQCLDDILPLSVPSDYITYGYAGSSVTSQLVVKTVGKTLDSYGKLLHIGPSSASHAWLHFPFSNWHFHSALKGKIRCTVQSSDASKGCSLSLTYSWQCKF